MKNLQAKKTLLEEALRKKSMEDMFTVVEEDNLVLFRTFQDIYANNCLSAIMISESAYTMINIFFGKLGMEEKRSEVLELINDLNRTYSVNKFVLSENDELIFQVPYISLLEDFNGDIVINLLRDLLVILVKKEYIKFQEEKYKGIIQGFEFRNKRLYGWEEHVETFNINGKEYSSRIFTKLFYDHIILRPSCYKCPYTSIYRDSDITLGDFWGVDKNINGF